MWDDNGDAWISCPVNRIVVTNTSRFPSGTALYQPRSWEGTRCDIFILTTIALPSGDLGRKVISSLEKHDLRPTINAGNCVQQPQGNDGSSYIFPTFKFGMTVTETTSQRRVGGKKLTLKP